MTEEQSTTLSDFTAGSKEGQNENADSQPSHQTNTDQPDQPDQPDQTPESEEGPDNDQLL